ncbi:hypothetical protein D3C75_1178390 [compost metagenome]
MILTISLSCRSDDKFIHIDTGRLLYGVCNRPGDGGCRKSIAAVRLHEFLRFLIGNGLRQFGFGDAR